MPIILLPSTYLTCWSPQNETHFIHEQHFPLSTIIKNKISEIPYWCITKWYNDTIRYNNYYNSKLGHVTLSLLSVDTNFQNYTDNKYPEAISVASYSVTLQVLPPVFSLQCLTGKVDENKPAVNIIISFVRMYSYTKHKACFCILRESVWVHAKNHLYSITYTFK